VSAEEVGEVLFSADQIAARIRELGQAISRDYAGRDLVLAGVLRGAAFFVVDLARALSIHVTIDFIAISSYGASSKAAGVVRIVKDLEEEIADGTFWLWRTSWIPVSRWAISCGFSGSGAQPACRCAHSLIAPSVGSWTTPSRIAALRFPTRLSSGTASTTSSGTVTSRSSPS
jgi:hypothetical protein